MRRSRWLILLAGGALVALFVGRWVAVHNTALWWARALDAADTHRTIASLRFTLDGAAFLGAALWCVGNLYLVYRQIGSVQVPRRVGNIEIVETIPRRFLLAGAVGIGLILAFALSRDAGDWWPARALAHANLEVGATEPILGRDLGYYLFHLPWLRATHGYLLLVVGIVLLLLILLYGAVGAIRWSERRLVFTDLARWHLGAVLAAFGLVLAWGYRLEPAELVGGLHEVPYDTVLTTVRIPTARALGGLSLLAAAASLVWTWLPRGLVPAIAWGVLAVTSFAGHYVAPAFVAAARGPARVAAAHLQAAQDDLTRAAFGLEADTVRLDLTLPDASFTQRHRDELLAAPLWDHFAVTHLLNRLDRGPQGAGFIDASLAVYPGPGGRPVPVYLAVRQPDTAAAEAYAVGVVAVHAAALGPGGRPRFVTSLARPDSLVDRPADLALRDPEVWFAPAATSPALAPPDRGPVGIPAGGFWRRLALVWALQAPRLLSGPSVQPGTVVLVDRAVSARLARFAPFARFGAAYPVVDAGRLVWVAPGYVASETYPLSVPVVWRGRAVRFLQAGFVGVVDARTGRTALYLRPDADPLSRAWSVLAPDLVRSADALPPGVRARLRYPEELFTAQLAILDRQRPGGVARAPEPFWWAGGGPVDPAMRLRMRAVIEVQIEPRVASVVDGYVRDGRPRLSVMDYPAPYTLPGPSELVRVMGREPPGGAAVAGTLRLVPFTDGAVAIQTFYTDSGTVADVAVGWRGAVGRGNTLDAALLQVRPVAPDTERPRTPQAALDLARELVGRMDSARVAGDWRTFGEAYDALRRLVTPLPDSTP